MKNKIKRCPDCNIDEIKRICSEIEYIAIAVYLETGPCGPSIYHHVNWAADAAKRNWLKHTKPKSKRKK